MAADRRSQAREGLGAQLVWVSGNHDRRPEFRALLLDQEPSGDELDSVHDLEGLRLVVLDTSVPGQEHGELADHQLRWLAQVLATPAPRGTVLAMHHPPIPVVIAPSDGIELHGQERLAAVLRGISGAVDVFPDQVVGRSYLQVEINREEAARYGVNVADIQEAIEVAMGGKTPA